MSNQHILKLIQKNLGGIPQYKFLKSKFNKEDLETIFTGYLSLIDIFGELSEETVDEINSALDLYRSKTSFRNSASSNSLPKIWKLFGQRQSEFVVYIRKVLESEDQSNLEILKKEVSKTAKMMSEAYQMNTQEGGYEFKDGDPKSDVVRWTYLEIEPAKSLGDTTYIHYFVAHLIDQIAVNWLRDNYSAEKIESNGMDSKKDGALSIFSDLLSYLNAKNELLTAQEQIFKFWTTERNQGGLGWLKPIRIRAFEEYFGG